MRRRSKLSSRERGQRYRRKLERAKGKPRIGRPRGSKTALSSLAQVRNLYIYLHEHGYSPESARAIVKRDLGTEVTDFMVTLWRTMGLLTHKHSGKVFNSGQYVKRDTILVGGTKP